MRNALDLVTWDGLRDRLATVRRDEAAPGGGADRRRRRDHSQRWRRLLKPVARLDVPDAAVRKITDPDQPVVAAVKGRSDGPSGWRRLAAWLTVVYLDGSGVFVMIGLLAG